MVNLLLTSISPHSGDRQARPCPGQVPGGIAPPVWLTQGTTHGEHAFSFSSHATQLTPKTHRNCPHVLYLDFSSGLEHTASRPRRRSRGKRASSHRNLSKHCFTQSCGKSYGPPSLCVWHGTTTRSRACVHLTKFPSSTTRCSGAGGLVPPPARAALHLSWYTFSILSR